MTPFHSEDCNLLGRGGVSKVRIHEARGRRCPGFLCERRSDLKRIGQYPDGSHRIHIRILPRPFRSGQIDRKASRVEVYILT